MHIENTKSESLFFSTPRTIYLIISKIFVFIYSRSIGAQYATGDQWRNNSRKNEGMEPKQKQYPVVDVTGDRSKV